MCRDEPTRRCEVRNVSKFPSSPTTVQANRSGYKPVRCFDAESLLEALRKFHQDAAAGRRSLGHHMPTCDGKTTGALTRVFPEPQIPVDRQGFSLLTTRLGAAL